MTSARVAPEASPCFVTALASTIASLEKISRLFASHPATKPTTATTQIVLHFRSFFPFSLATEPRESLDFDRSYSAKSVQCGQRERSTDFQQTGILGL